MPKTKLPTRKKIPILKKIKPMKKFTYTGTFKDGSLTFDKQVECRNFYEAFILLSAYAINAPRFCEIKSITDYAGNQVLLKDKYKINPFAFPIKFNGKDYVAIEKFNCHVISLQEAHGSGYTTVLPISDKEYRKKYGTKAKVKITNAIEGYTSFWCYDDLGNCQIMDIPNHLQKQIEFAKQAAIDNELFS